ncbi:hypothetical protein RB598_008225 [Gaeumannomyces tritici]
MEAAEHVPASPRVPDLVELPSDFWTPTQWSVFLALADAVLAPIVPESELEDKAAQIRMPDDQFAQLLDRFDAAVARPGGDSDNNSSSSSSSSSSDAKALARAVLKDSFSTNPALAGHLRRTVSVTVHHRLRTRIGGLLGALSTRTGALFLTGRCIPLHLQPLHAREAALRRWLASYLPAMRAFAKSVAALAQNSWVQASPLFKQASGYTDVPHPWRPGPGFEFEFLQFPRRGPTESDAGSDAAAAAAAAAAAESEPVVVETDVVIVGSGCGGGVCAKVLAEAGHRVLVLEKGHHHPPSQLPMPQEQGSRLLFENGGVAATTDGALNVVAGSTWGGGGTVNWSVCLQTQDYVRREWARGARGVPWFESAEFQACLDRVCDHVGAPPGSEAAVRHTHRGRALLDGCARLGWRAAPLRQNSGGAEHWCGRCTLGCHGGEKRGPAVSWLPDAARAGAVFAEGFRVDRVLFGGDEATGEKVATGVVGTWTSRDPQGGVAGPVESRVVREVVVKAKKVVVSAGSLWSPVILKKSGLENPNIGKNLYLHPCNIVGAYYDQELNPWEGGIITSYCSEFEDLDGKGHGVKLEATCQVPYMSLPMLPWRGAADFKLAAARFGRMDAYIALTRDRDPGAVLADPATGEPVIDYRPSAFDRAHTLEGVVALSRICHAAGAREIRPLLPGVEPFVRRPKEVAAAAAAAAEAEEKTDGQDAAFEAWVAELRRVGNAPPLAPFSSAHQMGTCRMAPRAEDGVVDPEGRVWGVDGLFVADASVFPSASGVNPMVTNLAIADWIARGVDRELRGAEVAGRVVG